MAVAQVISGAHQLERIGAGDVQQWLGAGDDAHDAAVFSLQAFAIVQGRLAALKEQADVFAARLKQRRRLLLRASKLNSSSASQCGWASIRR